MIHNYSQLGEGKKKGKAMQSNFYSGRKFLKKLRREKQISETQN